MPIHLGNCPLMMCPRRKRLDVYTLTNCICTYCPMTPFPQTTHTHPSSYYWYFVAYQNGNVFFISWSHAWSHVRQPFHMHTPLISRPPFPLPCIKFLPPNQTLLAFSHGYWDHPSPQHHHLLFPNFLTHLHLITLQSPSYGA